MSRSMKTTTKIAPRLANGDCRVGNFHRLPDSVKEGLMTIARKERKSMSWVVETVLIDYFDLERPVYKGEKPKRRRKRQRRR